VGGFVHHDLLLIFSGGRHSDYDKHYDIPVVRGIAGLENALTRRKFPDFNLLREDLGFVVVQKPKKGNVPKFFGIT